VINFFYSDKWVSDTCIDLFRAYSVHIFCCALNGISEAYFNAKADSETLTKMRRMMLVNSVMYLGLCYVFAINPGFFGFKGLIYANCMNMSVRATTCLYFTIQH
jgi:Na+-driven multidrug efflux pump